MKGQLAELLGEEYGAAGIWFDGWWDQQVKKLPHLNRPDADPKETQIDWRLRETFDLIHELRPEALIGNNHHVGVFPGEDFQMFEKDLPGQDFAGGNEDAVIGELPLEMCETINDYWGYNKDDQNFKSAKDLIRLLVRAAGFDANLLLNIGPMGSGKIQPEFVERLEQIGAWMEKNGESIYGTRGGPLEPQPWGVTTRKGGTVFVHVLEDEKAGEGADGGRKIELALGEGVKVQSARLMHGGEVKFEQSGQGTKAVILHLPEGALDLVDTIVVLETEEISD
ncbi:MAG TPA: alpha-L-fucosidase [Tepidisphaeraceae bacterium]|nr:alpha-L-fucosidase [Tepidisphaeraceae bacterium]